MRPYVVTERRCVWNKTFLLGPIVWNKVISCFISPHFIMFLIREMTTKASNGAVLGFYVLRAVHTEQLQLRFYYLNKWVS